MAVPGIPQNLYVQQGNGQVYLSWDLTATATAYSIHRSTDGVNYSTVASPVPNDYLDESVTVNTRYYYQVAATNSDGTGDYTIAQTIIPAKTGFLSLGELRLRSQQRADLEKSTRITLPQWNFFINQAITELNDLMITAYEDYYLAPKLIVTMDADGFCDLPDGLNYSGSPAFYKLYGVDLLINQNASGPSVTMKKFNFAERNKYQPFFGPVAGANALIGDYQYRVVGDKLMMIPKPQAGYQLAIWYYPRQRTLLRDTDAFDSINGWNEYVICRAAKYGLATEESDTSEVDAELLFLKKRIEESAQARDAGQPDTISNLWGSAGGFYGGSGDGSGGFY